MTISNISCFVFFAVLLAVVIDGNVYAAEGGVACVRISQVTKGTKTVDNTPVCKYTR